MRRHRLHLWLVALLIGGPLSWAKSDGALAFSIEDAGTFEVAVEEITDALESQGFEIFATIDHAANAPAADLDPTTVILAREPSTEVKLIRKSQTIGIDLPFKFLVWEDADGNIRFKYNDAGYLTYRHGVQPLDQGLLAIDRTVEQIGVDRGLVTIDSTRSVAETATAIIDALPPPLGIPDVIDYPAQSGRPGMSLRPMTLIIFGNPNVGTPLMKERQEIGIDLPQKFLVWEDADLQVHITWNDPFFVADRAGVQNQDQLLRDIATALADFAAAGAGGP